MSATRVITSSVLVPVVFIVVWFLPPTFFAVLAVVAAAIGQQELYAMARQRGATPMSVTGIVLGAAVILSMARPLQTMIGNGPLPWIVFGILVVLSVRLFSSRPVEGALDDIAVTLFGVCYVALLLGYQVAILAGIPGKRWLLFLYLAIWASDIGAYYVGTAYGRHRLYEKISPKKSIEGLLGGTVASMVVALPCKFWLVPSLGWFEALLVGLGLALVGTVGDLAESLIKRSFGVKDSGTVIPGHGGILDRLDSLMFAAPVLYYYLRLR